MCFHFFVRREKGDVKDIMNPPGGWQAEAVSEQEKHLGYFKGALLFGS